MAGTCSLKIFIWIQIIFISSEWLVVAGQLTPTTMVLPDSTIHGTPRHRFVVHDLSDVSGGKWKAVHIPDEEITSMLESTNHTTGNSLALDIEHEQPIATAPKMENSTYGQVHVIEHFTPPNATHTPIGNLIVAMDNEIRGKETKPLHSNEHGVINLRKQAKVEEPSTRALLTKTNPVRHPSLLVAKIPDDDDTEDELPLEKSEPSPIIAALRKSPLETGKGAMRNMIHKRARRKHVFGKESSGAWLNKILAQVRMPTITASLRNSLSLTKDGAARNQIQSNPIKHPLEKIPQAEQLSLKKPKIDSKTLQLKNSDNEALNKIKGLLLKSRLKSEYVPEVKTPTIKTVKTVEKTDNAPQIVPSKGAEDEPLSSIPSMKDIPSLESIFQSSKPNPVQNAFTNHATVLNRISSVKKEALLVGIIKALLARNKPNSSPRGSNMNAMPQFNREDVLQGIQSAEMQKTIASGQNNAGLPGVNPGGPSSTKTLEDFDAKQRNEQIKEELARANEESLEVRKLRRQEGTILSNYDRFLNPEDQTNLKGVMSSQESQTGEGQSVSVLGLQQLGMVAGSPTST